MPKKRVSQKMRKEAAAAEEKEKEDRGEIVFEEEEDDDDEATENAEAQRTNKFRKRILDAAYDNMPNKNYMSI